MTKMHNGSRQNTNGQHVQLLSMARKKIYMYLEILRNERRVACFVGWSSLLYWCEKEKMTKRGDTEKEKSFRVFAEPSSFQFGRFLKVPFFSYLFGIIWFRKTCFVFTF